MVTNPLYEGVANVLEYPGAGWRAQLDELRGRLEGEHPTVLAPLEKFFQDMEGVGLATLQERYTQTFDLNPVCTLDIGYHLFGENYKRGLFLANLQETEAPFELGQRGQLPDYLPVLLRLLTRLEDTDLRWALISDCLIPALAKMIQSLGQAGSPYGGLLTSINELLRVEAPACGNDFSPAAYETSASQPPELYQITPRAITQTQRSNRHA